MKSTKWIWTLIVIVCAGAAAAIIGFVLRYFSISSFLWPLPLVLVAPGLIGVAGLALAIQHANRPRLAMAITVACVLGWSFFMLGLFDFDLPGEPGGIFKHIQSSFIATTGIFALWGCFVVPVLALEAIDRPTRIARRSALFAGTSLALLWLIYLIGDTFSFNVDVGVWRVGLTIATLLASAAMLCLPLVYRLQQGRPRSEESKMQISNLLCPRCGTNCTVLDSTSRCGQCDLPIQLDRGELRCDCGYLLLNLDGNTCPECGRPFAARIRYEMVAAN